MYEYVSILPEELPAAMQSNSSLISTPGHIVALLSLALFLVAIGSTIVYTLIRWNREIDTQSISIWNTKFKAYISKFIYDNKSQLFQDCHYPPNKIKENHQDLLSWRLTDILAYSILSQSCLVDS